MTMQVGACEMTTAEEMALGCEAAQTDGVEPVDQPQAWDEPIPFFDSNLPGFPVDALPESIGKYVSALATSTQTPVDLAAMLSLAVMGAACAKKIVVEIKPGFVEPLNLYTITALPSGNRKSAVFKAMLEPIEAFEKAETKGIAPEIARGTTRYKVLEKSLVKAQEIAAKASDPAKRASLTAAAEDMAVELDSLRIPAYPQFLADDCSPESLASLLSTQHGRMALMSAEGDLFEIMGGRYSANKSPNLNVFLKGHSGDELRVNRIGRPPEYIHDPALTIGLAVQPEVIEGLAGKPGFRGKGLLARFLYSLPESRLGHRRADPPTIPGMTLAAFNQAITNLLALPMSVDSSGDVSAYVLRLDDCARETVLAFMEFLEPKLEPLGELGFISDWAGKLTGAIARIAALIHLAETADRDKPWDIPVADQILHRAIKIGEYLIPHAIAAFGTMGADPVVEATKRILSWIKREGLATFTKREAWQALRGRYSTAADMDPHLAFLVTQGYIREGQRPAAGPGRPSRVFEVNPNFGDIGDIG